MKTLLVVLLSLFFIISTLAQNVTLSAEKKSAIVKNLTIGLETDNQSLNASAANVLYKLILNGYLRSDDASIAMIPLLRLLSNGTSDEARVAAAFALFELGNGIGIYRLRGVAKFDDNLKVSSVCKNLYYSYHKINGTEYFLDF